MLISSMASSLLLEATEEVTIEVELVWRKMMGMMVGTDKAVCLSIEFLRIMNNQVWPSATSTMSREITAVHPLHFKITGASERKDKGREASVLDGVDRRGGRQLPAMKALESSSAAIDSIAQDLITSHLSS